MRQFRAGLQPGITRGSLYSVIILFVVMIVLTGASYALESNAISRAQRNTASITQLCQLGNDSRAQQIRLWQFVISISRPPPHETAKQERQRQATLRTFEAYLHRVFAPRDCSALGQHHG
jgi:hypothetical protein